MSYARRWLWLFWAAVLGFARALPAQTGDSAVWTSAAYPAALAAAAGTITAAGLTRKVVAMVADSFHNRPTPSPGLEAAARYIAVEFQRLGLRPAHFPWMEAADTNWVKRYPLPGVHRELARDGGLLPITGTPQPGPAATAFAFVDEHGWHVEHVALLSFKTTAWLATDSLGESTLSLDNSKMVVVSGRPGSAPPPCISLAPLVLYVPPAGLDSAVQAAVIAQMTACAPVLVVAAGESDSATFAAHLAAAAARSTVVFDRYSETVVGAGARAWAAYVAPRAIAPVLRTAGLDLAAVWADTVPRVRALPTLSGKPWLVFDDPRNVASGVYVAGMLPGDDSLSYIVYSAALDNDSSHGRNISDATASGIGNEVDLAGLLSLAEAFTRLGTRPRHSVLFLATSGTRQHFAGASHFLYPMTDAGASMVDLTLAGLGGTNGDIGADTLVLTGLRDFAFKRRPEWLQRAHPELGLTVADGGAVWQPTSIHYAFAQYGYVSLRLAARTDRDSLTLAGLAAGRAEMAARALRWAFYFGQDLANTPNSEWPDWTREARNARLLHDAGWERGP